MHLRPKSREIRQWCISGAVWCILFLVFCTLTVPAQLVNKGISISVPRYQKRVHQGDLIDIHVAGHLDFDWRGRLNPEGFLDGFDKIPNPIFGQCRTEDEIAIELQRILALQLRDPSVEVKILDISQRPVATVDGAVAVQTRFQIRREVRLIELITAAGGITDRSSGTIGIIRPKGQSCVEGDGPLNAGKPFEIAIADLLSGDPAANPIIVSGDIVVVGEARPIYVVGAVPAQGRIDFRPQLTASRAIDAAGGTLGNADLAKVTIFRRGAVDSSPIRVDLQKVRSDPTNDIELMPYDIIDVAFKGRPPRKLPPIIEIDTGESDKRLSYPMKIID